MLMRFYSPTLMGEFEQQLNSLLVEMECIPEQYRRTNMDLIKMRKFQKEVVIATSAYDEREDRIENYLHLMKIQYMNDLEAKKAARDAENYQRTYKLEIALEGEEETLRRDIKYGLGDSVEKEAINELVPTKLLINKEETLFVLYNNKTIVAGYLPHWKPDTDSASISELREEGTIDVRIVGLPFAKESGREILKAEFHPLNGSYLGVLTNKGIFSLYNLTSDLDKPEQEFDVFRKSEMDKTSITKKSIASFCFGTKQNYGWTAFSVFFMTQAGDVYNLCPVVPGALFIEPALVDALSEIVRQEAGESSKHHRQKAEFVKMLTEAKPDSSNEYCMILDTSRLAALKPLLQGPIKICRSLSGDTAQKNFIDLVSFDYFPYVYVTTTDKGALDALFCWEDTSPVFQDSIRGGIGLHDIKRASSTLSWIHFSRVMLTPEIHPQIYSSSSDPYTFFAGIGPKLYQVSNPWLYALQKQYIEGAEGLTKDFIRTLEPSQAILVAKGESSEAPFIGLEALDDYVILMKPTDKVPRIKIFNVYNTLMPKQIHTEYKTRIKKEERRLEERAEKLEQIMTRAKLQPINYKGLTAVEPFSFKEEKKELESLQVLEELQKALPGYFAVTKKKAEKNTMDNNLEIIKKHENQIEKMMRELENKIEEVNKNRGKVETLKSEIERKNEELGKGIETISLRMSQAELPLNPKEQKIKDKVDAVDIKVREAAGQLKEEVALINKEKKYEVAAANKLVADKETAEEFIVTINKWYPVAEIAKINSIRRIGKIGSELKAVSESIGTLRK